jgi:hypothetical protein
MKFDPSIYHRHSIRLKDYDTSQSGAYFITLVAQDRLNLFGEFTDGVMCLSRIGEITRSAWLRLADLFPIRHDEWVIMPNHLHAIIWILDLGRGEASASKDFLDPWRSLTDASPQHQASASKEFLDPWRMFRPNARQLGRGPVHWVQSFRILNPSAGAK